MKNKLIKTVLIISIIIILIIITMNILFRKQEKQEIEKYINREIKVAKYEISDNPIMITKEEYHDGKIWTIEDKDNNFYFHIYRYYYNVQADIYEIRIEDDYEQSLFLNFYNKYPKKDNIIINELFLTKFGFNDINLICYANTKEELDNCYDSLKYYNEKTNLEIKYNIYYKALDNELIYITEGNLYNILENYNEWLKKLYIIGIEFQDSNIIDDMTEEDYKSINEDKNVKKIVKINSDGTEKIYQKLVSNNYSIPVGILYQILKEENLIISGNPMHYISKNNKADIIEISYDFLDGYHSYYFLNNEKKSFSYLDGNFSTSEIEEIYNIKIEFRK